jgi:hypothetical protein
VSYWDSISAIFRPSARFRQLSPLPVEVKACSLPRLSWKGQIEALEKPSEAFLEEEVKEEEEEQEEILEG